MPTRPGGRRARGAHARGYDYDHERRSREAIAAEPWCHNPLGCPFPDAGTPANPLTGGHPRTLAQMGGDFAAWKAQRRVPTCNRCNSGRLDVE